MAKSKKVKTPTTSTTKQQDQSDNKKAPTSTSLQQQKNKRFPTLIPKSHLQVTELEPNQIYLIPQFFTRKECQSLIAYFDTHLTPQAVSSLIPKPGEAFRSNDRQSMQDPLLANKIWSLGLDQICASNEGIHTVSMPRRPCGLNSNLRIYRYRPGQRFEAHYDDSVKDTVTGHWTDWTLLIYLNGGNDDDKDDGLEGGETVFYKEDIGGNKKKKRVPKRDPLVVQPEEGLALLHRHGQHCLLHEALEVTRGNKWVLRSDVLIG